MTVNVFHNAWHHISENVEVPLVVLMLSDLIFNTCKWLLHKNT